MNYDSSLQQVNVTLINEWILNSQFIKSTFDYYVVLKDHVGSYLFHNFKYFIHFSLLSSLNLNRGPLS